MRKTVHARSVRGLLPGLVGALPLLAVARAAAANGEPPAPAEYRPGVVPVLGYASLSESTGDLDCELSEQAEAIAGECERRGLALLELVGEREPQSGKAIERPGLDYALKRIAAGEAKGLVVSELSRLSHSAAELGAIFKWFTRWEARLVAVAGKLDTGERDGRIAASTLIEVAGWERQRLSERTRRARQAARPNGRPGGRPGVADDPRLREWIRQMRAQHMSLQAIADRLNQEGVPTLRGGKEWRPSSLQAATGYKRPRRTQLSATAGADETRELESQAS